MLVSSAGGKLVCFCPTRALFLVRITFKGDIERFAEHRCESNRRYGRLDAWMCLPTAKY